MRWGPWARRRADEFDALVERSSTGVAGDGARSRDAELLELVGALRAVPDPEARPEFVADLRARLLAEAETALEPADLSKLRLPARRTTRERRIAAVVGGIVIAGTTASVAVASQSALPGESLYAIKRVIESVHADLSPGEARKGNIELASAGSRLDEALALARSSDDGAALRVAPTLSAFTEQATSGADLLLADHAHTGREQAITRLHEFAATSMAQLAELEPLVPEDARDELVAAADIVAQIDAEATQECPECGGSPLDIPPGLLAAQMPELPVLPPIRDEGRAQPGRGAGPSDGGPGKGGKGSTIENGGSDGVGGAPHQDGQPPAQSDVDSGGAPPASGPDPGDAAPSPTTRPNPIKSLTDGLTDVLTGGGSAGSGSGSSPPPPAPSTSAPPGPITTIVQGVDDILSGVLDPITGQLLPKR